MTRRKKSKPIFTSLPLRKRAQMVFELKKMIEADEFRNFASHDHFGDGLSWADVLFVGRDKFTLWNATFMTVIMKREDLKESVAVKKAYGALTPEEHAHETAFNFGPRLANGCRAWIPPERRNYEKFDGRTVHEQVNYLKTLEDPVVFQSVELLSKYQYGIGLDVVLDVPRLTPDIISDFIDAWVKEEAMGETKIPSKYTEGYVQQSNLLTI